jgi:hypothetical protein
MSEQQDGTPAPKEPFRAQRSTQNFLIIFLTMTLILTTVGMMGYGIATGKVGFTGSIDVSILLGVALVTGIGAILRTVFGKSNVG